MNSISDRLNVHIIHKQIGIISLIYALLIIFGFYGFGKDYYGTYHEFNSTNLGFILTSFHFYGVPIGAGITSFLLAYSVGILFLLETNKFQYKFPFFSFIFLLNCWPILMLVTNVMRQGLALAFTYISIALYLNNFKKFSFALILSTFFIHEKNALFNIPIFVFSIMIYEFYRTSLENKNILIFFNNIILFLYFLIIVFLILNNSFDEGLNSRVIGGDFTLPFFIINIIYISYFLLKGDYSDFLSIFVFYSSIAVIPIYIIGYSWEYERVNMGILLIYIICLSREFSFFKVRSVFIFNTVILLILISLFQGIYTSLD